MRSPDKLLRKFMKSPGRFWRDHLLNRYPLILNETGISRVDEPLMIDHFAQLEGMFEFNNPVDVVYTWVDDADPIWRRKMNGHQRPSAKLDMAPDADDPARFSNKEELRYSIISIKKFMPWVNKIFVISDNQRPQWAAQSDIIFVNHSAIIESQYLPTFNSHVIEAHLSKIPELSEYFVYFNDDVFAARPLSKQHFFQANGLASLFASRKSISAMAGRSTVTATLDASRNAAELLWDWYGQRVDTPLVHTYVPLRKSTFEKVSDRLAARVSEFSGNKFRSANDVNLATFLVPWVQYFEGQASLSTDICHYFNVRSKGSKFHWQALEDRDITARPHSFCANDVRVTNTEIDLQAQLDKIFGVKP